MIELLSQSHADRLAIPPSKVQCVSPYLNPAHVLSPPRDWLEELVHGAYGWPLFRMRYKALLRERLKDEPYRFYHLLQASEANRKLYLTCHCLTSVCHRQIAREFLEMVRSDVGYQDWLTAQSIPLFNPAHLVEHPLSYR